jgi:hypothetical protein
MTGSPANKPTGRRGAVVSRAARSHWQDIEPVGQAAVT